MKCFTIFITMLVLHCFCVFGDQTHSVDEILGVWNHSSWDSIRKGDIIDSDYRIRIKTNGKTYGGFLNSVVIERNKPDELRIFCDGGNDIIINTYTENEVLILEVISEDRDTKAKISVTLFAEDIIYFTLLEGETYSFIDYGEEYPYTRAREIK